MLTSKALSLTGIGTSEILQDLSNIKERRETAERSFFPRNDRRSD